MTNILSLAILSKAHCIYLDTNIDIALYVFDQKDRSLSFYNFPITNLYCLDTKEAKSEGAVLNVITVQGQK